MTQERTLATQRIYEGRVVNLRVDTVELPDGGTSKREIVEHRGCVAIVALDGHGNVLLVRQFRKAVERTLLEVPAGGMDSGESPEECVRRELREETGYLPRRVEKLGGFYSSPGFCTEFLHLYLARDLELSPLASDVDENIEVVPVPLEEIPRLIRSGEICDAKSIAGLLTFLHLGQDPSR